MIKYYIRMAWRSLVKDRFFTLLNISGLAVSIVVAIFLLSYAQQELGINANFSKGNDIYRVNMKLSEAFNFEKWVQLPNAVGPAMLEDIPEVEAMARLVRHNFGGTSSLRWENQNFLVEDFYLTDAAFFDLFDFEFIEGNKETVFEKPNSIVISETQRKKIFGNHQALNQQLTINQDLHFTVTGIFRDLPENISFDGKVFANILDSWMGEDVYWSNASYETYVQLHPDADAVRLQKEATNLIDKYVQKENQYFTQFVLQPVSKIYLHSNNLEYGYSSKSGNISHVRLFFVLSFLILGMAAINYINLTTARSQNNAKEVGINKVLGADPKHIRLRFFMETATLVLIAVLLAVALAMLTIPWFNQLTGNQFTMAELLTPDHLLLFVGLWLFISLLGGSYPAFVMSRMPTLGLMKKWAGKNNLSEGIRKSLVVFQFTCSIILIIGVIIMNQQMRYVSEKDLGYQPQNVLSIPTSGFSSYQQVKSVQQEFRNLAGTKSVSAVQTYPGDGESGKTVYKPGDTGEGLPVLTNFSLNPIATTLGLDLIAGTDLPETLVKTDSTGYVVINELVAAYLGYANPQDAIGKKAGIDWIKDAEIKGVVRNFNFGNLKEKIGAYVFYKTNHPTEGFNYLLLNFEGQNASSYLAQVKEIFENRVPEAAFDYLFLDDYIKNQYRAENRSEAILTVFSVLAIFIACLGLFGLAAFTAEQRKKEIGVRKVLGASVLQIVQLLSQQFSQLILWALFISIPMGWWVFSEWLNEFAYRIQISWLVFLLAAVLVLLIAAIPIGFQSLKAAWSNPIDSLRDE